MSLELRNNVFFTTKEGKDYVATWELNMNHHIEEFVKEMKLPIQLHLPEYRDEDEFKAVDANNKKFTITPFFGGLNSDGGIQVSIGKITKTYLENWDIETSTRLSIDLRHLKIKRERKTLEYHFAKTYISITLKLPKGNELYVYGEKWCQRENWDVLSDYLFNLRCKRNVEDVYGFLKANNFVDNNSSVHIVYTKGGSHKLWECGYIEKDESWIDIATEYAIAEASVENGKLQSYSHNVKGTFVRAYSDGSYEIVKGSTDSLMVRIIFDADTKRYKITTAGESDTVFNMEEMAIVAKKKAAKLWKTKNVMF